MHAEAPQFRRRPRRGFSLLEIIIVSAVLVVVAAMAVPRFIVVERTEASPEWWAAATAARDVPTAILPLIRGGGATKEQKVLCQSSLADGIETWAAALPGWYGTEDGANPLVLRNASKEDLALLR